MNHPFALALLCLSVPCWPQQAPATLSAAPDGGRGGEPEVKRTVIEDDGARIDELRVRGEAQRIVVTPKVGMTKPYEIIMSRSGREPVDGTGGANSAAGKRVWNLLAF